MYMLTESWAIEIAQQSYPIWTSLVAQTVNNESTCNVGDLGSIPGLGRSPGEDHGNTLQYSCLENPDNRGAWRATAHGVAKSQTQLRDSAQCSTYPTH